MRYHIITLGPGLVVVGDGGLGAAAVAAAAAGFLDRGAIVFLGRAVSGRIAFLVLWFARLTRVVIMVVKSEGDALCCCRSKLRRTSGYRTGSVVAL